MTEQRNASEIGTEFLTLVFYSHPLKNKIFQSQIPKLACLNKYLINV